VCVDDIINSISDFTIIVDFETIFGSIVSYQRFGCSRYLFGFFFYHYLFGIEVDHSSQDIFLSQNLMFETGLLDARPVDTPMNSTVKLDGEHGELFIDVGQCSRLVGKLIYLTATCPDIT
jgi:hypothetical protein